MAGQDHWPLDMHSRLAEAVHTHHLDEPVLTDRFEGTCRTLARVWSLVAVGVFVYLALQIGAPRSTSYQPWEESASLLALGVTSFGLALAWKWEGFGGALALAAGIGLGALAALEYHPALAFGVAACSSCRRCCSCWPGSAPARCCRSSC